MPTPTETAKAIVREWANWADRGMYIANGMIDPKALARLEASIATSLVSAEAPLREALDALTQQRSVDASRPHPVQFLDRAIDRPVPLSGPPATKKTRRVKGSSK